MSYCLLPNKRRLRYFVTTDQNLKHQQNLANYRLTIVILTTTSWPLIERQIYDVITAIRHSETIQLG